MKKILVLSANPKPTSLTQSLAKQYTDTAQADHDVKFMDISALHFAVNLNQGHDQEQPLEADLIDFQQALTWCDHFVLFTPIWWGSIPAKLKGLFDRTLLPGYAFQYVSGNAFPKQLLTGKTARVVMLMDTPPWYYRLVQRSPAVKELSKPVLNFVGIKPVKFEMFGPVIHSSDQTQNKWRSKVKSWARQGV